MRVRSEAFHRIGGFDERYEGWGGEDNDFFLRYDLAAPFDVHDDVLLHLHHPRSVPLMKDGRKVKARIPWATRQPTEPIGRLDRFAAPES